MCCYLVVVGKLACLNYAVSFSGGGFNPWQVQPVLAGYSGEDKLKAAPGPPGWGLGVGLTTHARKQQLVSETATTLCTETLGQIGNSSQTSETMKTLDENPSQEIRNSNESFIGLELPSALEHGMCAPSLKPLKQRRS